MSSNVEFFATGSLFSLCVRESLGPRSNGDASGTEHKKTETRTCGPQCQGQQKETRARQPMQKEERDNKEKKTRRPEQATNLEGGKNASRIRNPAVRVMVPTQKFGSPTGNKKGAATNI